MYCTLFPANNPTATTPGSFFAELSNQQSLSKTTELSDTPIHTYESRG